MSQYSFSSPKKSTKIEKKNCHNSLAKERALIPIVKYQILNTENTQTIQRTI
jgi:hypothetical protein